MNNKIQSILEGIHKEKITQYGKVTEYVQENTGTRVIEDCINENILDKIEKRIVKDFGKITKVREFWLSPESEDYPTDIKSKFISVNTNIEGLDPNTIKQSLSKRLKLTFDDITKIVYKTTKMHFTVEKVSNCRIVLLRNAKKYDRIEIRYNKKLMTGDEEDNTKVTISSNGEVEVIKTNKAVATAFSNAVKNADKFTKKDKDEIPKMTEKVKDSLSIETNPIEKKSISISDIVKEGGCDEDTAKEAANIASSVFDKAANEEPSITETLIPIVSGNGGSMYGLNFRLKQGTSLGRKIVSDQKESPNKTLQQMADNIKDAIRYTAVFPIESFTQAYFNTKKSLESSGFTEVRCKNFYAMFRDGKSQQKAIQCVYDSPNGVKFELQFHTIESQGAKEVNHPLYEKFRDSSTSLEDRRMYDLRMINISNNVPDPENVFSIESHG